MIDPLSTALSSLPAGKPRGKKPAGFKRRKEMKKEVVIVDRFRVYFAVK